MVSFDSTSKAEEVAAAFAAQVKQRTFLITGAGGGLAVGALVALAQQSPKHFILLARSEAKVTETIKQISAVDPAIKTTFVPCDLTDFDSVRVAAQNINENEQIPQIDVVINSAGIMDIKEYTKDKQGNELTLSANHLGHFLLTNLILPKVLAAGPGARIVALTSNGYRIAPFHFDDPNFKDGKDYEGWTAYGSAKTAVNLFCVELSRRLQDRGVRAYSVHPGVIMTGLGAHLVQDDFAQIFPMTLKNTGRPFPADTFSFKSVEQGAAPIVAAALDPALDAFAGAYIQDCQPVEALDHARDPEVAGRCWSVSESLVGQKFDF